MAADDAVQIYFEHSGVEWQRTKSPDDFTNSWKEFLYKPIRKDPLTWFKQNILGEK